MLSTVLRRWSWCYSYLSVVYYGVFRFASCLALCSRVFFFFFFFVFFSPFSIVISSLGEEIAGLCAFCAFVCLFCIPWFLSFFSSSWYRVLLRLVIVALPVYFYHFLFVLKDIYVSNWLKLVIVLDQYFLNFSRWRIICLTFISLLAHLSRRLIGDRIR